MSNKSNFNIRFYIRRDQTNKDGTATIMVRVTVNSERSVFSSKLSVDPKCWDNNANRAIGATRAIRELNKTLEDIKGGSRKLPWQGLPKDDTNSVKEERQVAYTMQLRPKEFQL